MTHNINDKEVDMGFGAISVAEYKIGLYGMVMPLVIIFFFHSLTAMVAAQILVYTIQRGIDKERAVLTAKFAVLTIVTAIMAFVVLTIS